MHKDQVMRFGAANPANIPLSDIGMNPPSRPRYSQKFVQDAQQFGLSAQKAVTS